MSKAQEDPFSTYTERLAGSDPREERSLVPWQRDVLAFRRLTDGVVWEGMVGAIANMWCERVALVGSLRAMGLDGHADQIEQAMRQAEELGHGSHEGLDESSIHEAPELSALFNSADQAFNADWQGVWAAAETYARRNGWSEEAT
jgi:hypothetical protein